MPAAVQTWLDDDAVLARKTGQTRAEIDYIWSVVKDTLDKHYEQHHRQREPPLSPFASLLVTLHYLRVYPTTRDLADDLGTDHKRIRECLNHTLKALFDTLVPQGINHSPLPRQGYNTGILAGVRLIVDATFLPLPRTPNRKVFKKNFHFKSPMKQALKWQIVVTTRGAPWHISKVVRGSVADVTLLRESGVLDRLVGDARMLADMGYIGEAKVITPKKKPKGGELKTEDKKNNRYINSKRAVVENCVGAFKEWSILRDVYRGPSSTAEDLEKVTEIVHVIGAMVKRKLTSRPLRA